MDEASNLTKTLLFADFVYGSINSKKKQNKKNEIEKIQNEEPQDNEKQTVNYELTGIVICQYT